MDYQDVITFEPKDAKVISEKHKVLFTDERYHTIIVALRKGPMTVRDLEKEYNKIIEEKIKGKQLSKKDEKDEIEKSKRKGKTLYKYLDELMKYDVVVEAGRRIRKGQTATETLYGRTAKIFVSTGYDKFPSFEDESVWSLIAEVVRSERKKSKVDIDCFVKAVQIIYKKIQDTRVDIFTKYSKEISEISPKISHKSLGKVAMILEIFHILDNATDFENGLEKCFR